jgi:hypothetical protein
MKWARKSRARLLLTVLVLALMVAFSGAASAEQMRWQPTPGTSWQWQLSGTPVDTSFDVDAYDVDGFDNDAAVVADIHATGAKAICYISAGSWENWRPDADAFADSMKGRNNG